jgi:hypothetical protein
VPSLASHCIRRIQAKYVHPSITISGTGFIFDKAPKVQVMGATTDHETLHDESLDQFWPYASDVGVCIREFPLNILVNERGC